VARAAVPGRLSGRLTWRPATLTAYRDEAPGARTLELDVPDWPGHLAGQHVDVRLTAPDGYQARRSYSLAAPARGNTIALTVQAVPRGEVSPYLTEVFSVGDAIEVRGPLGGWFVWRPDDVAPVLLVAGGSGIVPLMAMVRTRRQAGSRALFRLVYSVRDPQSRCYVDELRVPQPGDGGLDISYVYTRDVPAEFTRPAGRINADDLTAHGWPPDLAPWCFVCGPTGFVETVADLLVGIGHDASRIKTERFGPTGG
jgi:ferredoxin-NADP reductase